MFNSCCKVCSVHTISYCNNVEVCLTSYWWTNWAAANDVQALPNFLEKLLAGKGEQVGGLIELFLQELSC